MSKSYKKSTPKYGDNNPKFSKEKGVRKEELRKERKSVRTFLKTINKEVNFEESDEE